MASMRSSRLWIYNILLFSTLLLFNTQVRSLALHSSCCDGDTESAHTLRKLASSNSSDPGNTINSTQEADALMEFRNGVIQDPSNMLSLWGSDNSTFCSWTGVACQAEGHVRALYLSGYSLSGSISKSLGLLQFLSVLDLSDNNFTGIIPPELSSLGNLVTLNLSANTLEGFIPSQLGLLQSLQLLLLSYNNLTGSIPRSLANCSRLTQLVLSQNELSGNISLAWEALGQLRILYLAENRLGGPIPASLGNCSALREIDLPGNFFVGDIPSSLGRLQDLEHFRAFSNSLSGRIPTSLGNLSSLVDLYLYENFLSGRIPRELGVLSNLQFLSLWSNNLDGPIPTALVNCSELAYLELSYNHLTGGIPQELGKLKVLERLSVQRNNLEEQIPQSIGNASALQYLFLDGNSLTGEIPAQLGQLVKLVQLSLASNGRISGPIPPEIGNLASIETIDFSFNNLSGVIPSNFSSCRNLRSLNLASNDLAGEIPVSLTTLHFLNYLNVSFNHLTGPIPENGSFRNLSFASFEGNPSLCGQQVNKDCSGCKGVMCDRAWIYAVAGVAGVLASIAVVVCVCFFCNVKRNRLAPVIELPPMNHFTDEITLSVADLMVATDGFSDNNVIGVGGRSTVYKGILPTGQIIAVKRLVLGTDERAVFELYGELQLLSSLEHRNLLRIYGLCATTEITALILEYMANGSLHKQLHEWETCHLTWEQRLDIAVGVADALVYLHHDFAKPILHLDLKPSNILLDEVLKVKVADYGISRYVNHERHGEATLSSSLYGTIGYIPPEYGESPNVSTKGDIYNFGVIIMELLTRKKPTDDMFDGQEASSLRNWVLDAFPDRLSEVLDATLKKAFDANEEAMRRMLRLGLSCTQESPRDRPTATQVRDRLEDIRLPPLQPHQKVVRFRE